LALGQNFCHGDLPGTNYVCRGSIDFIRPFSDFAPTDFSSLTHLVIEDSIKNIGDWTTPNYGGSDWEEHGRLFIGIHELISSLPQLRHLWVNEHVLVISKSGDDFWDEKFQEAIMSRTAASPEWDLLGQAFEKLESLRVGFGPLNAGWVAKVLSLCNHTKLKAFGFDWEWQPGSKKLVRTFVYSIPSEILTTLC
jgi:hypothetical protein